MAHEYGVFYSHETALDVSSHDFTLAFGVSDYLTNEAKNRTDLLRWQVEAIKSDGDEGALNNSVR